MQPLLSSCLASHMQHRAATNNNIASFSFCSKCRFWECDSTLLGYQILRASAVSSRPVVPQTAGRKTGTTDFLLFFHLSNDIRWPQLLERASTSVWSVKKATGHCGRTPSLSRRNIPAWWWCVEEKKPSTPSSAGRMGTNSEVCDWLPAEMTANAGW